MNIGIFRFFGGPLARPWLPEPATCVEGKGAAALACWLGLLLVATGVRGDDETTPLKLAAGPAQGALSQTAARIQDERDDLAIEHVLTDGSFDSLAKLEAAEGGVDLALVQQDVAAAFAWKRSSEGKGVSFKIVDRPFYLYLHILVRPPLYLDTAADLASLRLFLGPTTADGGLPSDSRFTAIQFLEGVGIPRHTWVSDGEGVDTSALTMENLGSRFLEGEIDAAMWVTTAGGNVQLCDILSRRQAEILPVDYRTLPIVIDDIEHSRATARSVGGSFFQSQLEVTSLPAETYPFQIESVPTIAVPVLLLTSLDGEDPRVGALREAIREAWQTRQEWLHPFADEPSAQCPFVDPGLDLEPLEESGLEVYQPAPQLTGSLVNSWTLALLTLGLVMLGALVTYHFLGPKDWRRLLRRWLSARFALVLGVTVILSIVLITFLTYLVEHRRNEHFSSFGESFWSITIFIFSGLEDRSPYTISGRVIATFGLLLGPLTFALVTGRLASYFIHLEETMPKHLTDHYLLLNWNERAPEIIRQLHHPVLTAEETPVIVVMSNDRRLSERFESLGSDRDERFEDVYVNVGDPNKERALLNANALDARTIVVLANEALEDRADESTLRSVILLRKLARERQASSLHVVAELLDVANDPVLEEIGHDFPGDLERVSGSRERTFLLAQATLSQGVTGFYRDLLSVSDATNEIYLVPVPEGAVGQPFGDYAARIFTRETSEPWIPVGIQRFENGRSRFLSNPRPTDSKHVLREGDQLVLLAYGPPRVDELPSPQ